MSYIKFRSGLNLTSKEVIDKRIYLTKAEMLTAEDDYLLPDVYFAVCPDDGKLYIYNSSNEVNETTGKYRAVGEILDFNNEAFKNNFKEALANSEDIIKLKSDVETLKTDVAENKEQISIWI